jgi:radical SAM protein with 4Fe4S-binding SPASM domain
MIKTILKSLRSPLRAVNMARLKLGLRHKSTRVPVLPSVLDIEPTTTCNLKCKMCQVPMGYLGNFHLGLDDFKRVVGQFPHLLRIKLQGMGEPFLNRHFFEMVAHAKGKGITVGTTTNGMLVDEGKSRAILESGLDEIYFSLDGATKETFEEIRGGAQFETVVANIKRLIEMKGMVAAPIVGVWFVGMKSNIRELPDLVRLCRELRVDRLAVQVDMCAWGKDDLDQKVESFRLEPADLDYVRRAQVLALELQLEFILNEEKIPAGKLCDWPWYSAYITAESKVVPCCLIADAKVVNFGSLKEQSIQEIWNSTAYQDFRRAHLSGEIPAYCRRCYPD